MRFGSLLVAASAAGSAMGAMSICSKYTIALLKDDTPANELTLLTLLVKTAVLGPFTGKGTPNPTLPGNMYKVDGILTPGTYMGEKVNLAAYFDGSMAVTNVGGKAKKVNWLDGAAGKYGKMLATDPTFSGKAGSNTETLLTHLYSYFGLLLGCPHVGMGAYPAYEGVASQYEVHEFMKLSEAEFAYFVTQVGAAALSFGVTMKDAVAAGTALNDTFGLRCAPAVALGGAPKVLESICTASDCPKSPMADCSYGMGGGMGGSPPSGGNGGNGGGSGDAATMSFSKSLVGIAAGLLGAFAWL